MACCAAEGDKVSSKRNTEINKDLRDERKKQENEVKLLLLGAGESGKSTIAKQMKIIHLNGFSNEEKKTYKTIIFNNIVSSMRALIEATEHLEINIGDSAAKAAKRINEGKEEYFTGPLTLDMAKDIKELWADPGIQFAFESRHKFQLTDSADYYFENVDRIVDEQYIPHEQDILRSRAKTTGIIETDFVLDKTHFRMVDVGGQRSERKKWMHCFQDVTAVIFCVAMSEYDLKLYEDDSTNRMHESLKLFREICNSKWFVDTAMILFLNKKDLFEQKIKKTDLTICFPEYKGGKDYNNAAAYIQERFLAQNDNQKKPIYPHSTQATDTHNIEVVFNAVKDIILRKALDSAGIM